MPVLDPIPSVTVEPPTEDVVKTWSLQTVQGIPYTIAVLADASLWLIFGNTTYAQLNIADFGPAISQVRDTIIQILSENSICDQTKAISETVTLVCDLLLGHVSKFHHDPVSKIYWLSDG